eukprot:m.1640752 g.1640752  ORF g.1640752 m.1640752 type:complete len:81 (+) comp43685_c0_seq1:165-407(+)
MHPLVRDLYKRCMLVGRDYPGGMDVVRRKAKEYFFMNKSLNSEDDIKRAVARGRRYLNDEVIGVIKLKKYRTMAKRYGTH